MIFIYWKALYVKLYRHVYVCGCVLIMAGLRMGTKSLICIYGGVILKIILNLTSITQKQGLNHSHSG